MLTILKMNYSCSWNTCDFFFFKINNEILHFHLLKILPEKTQIFKVLFFETINSFKIKIN